MDYNINREADGIIRALESLGQAKGAVDYNGETFDAAQKMSGLSSYIWSPSSHPLKEGLDSLKTKMEAILDHMDSLHPNEAIKFSAKMTRLKELFKSANINLQNNVIPAYYDKKSLQNETNSFNQVFMQSMVFIKNEIEKRSYEPLSKARNILPSQQTKIFSKDELDDFVLQINQWIHGIKENNWTADSRLIQGLDDFIHKNIEKIMGCINIDATDKKNSYRREKIADFADVIKNEFNNPDAELLAKELNSYITAALLNQNDVVKELFHHLAKNWFEGLGVDKSLQELPSTSNVFNKNRIPTKLVKINPSLFEDTNDAIQYIIDQKVIKIDLSEFPQNEFHTNTFLDRTYGAWGYNKLFEHKTITGLAVRHDATATNLPKMESLTYLQFIYKKNNRREFPVTTPVEAFAEACPNLKTIIIDSMWSGNYKKLGMLCPYLETIEIPWSHISKNDALEITSAFPNLRSISLSKCKIENESLLKIIKGYPDLEEIDISGTRSELSKNELENTKTILNTCTKLKTLVVSDLQIDEYVNIKSYPNILNLKLIDINDKKRKSVSLDKILLIFPNLKILDLSEVEDDLFFQKYQREFKNHPQLNIIYPSKI